MLTISAITSSKFNKTNSCWVHFMKNFDSFKCNQENKFFRLYNSNHDNLSNYRKTGGRTILTGTVSKLFSPYPIIINANHFQYSLQSTLVPILLDPHLSIHLYLCLRQFSSTKIKPQAKIDNFSFKNSNIIIDGCFEKEPNFFSYRFLPNFKKLCDSNKLQIQRLIFQRMKLQNFGRISCVI